MGWRYVVVPEWQGSGSSRAMRLADGAAAILGDLPSSRTVEVEAPSGAGDALGTGVARLSSIVTVRDRLLVALGGLPAEDTALIIGGDCGADLGAIEHAVANNDAMCLVYFDAHGDLNTPESSPSSAFNGMVLRTLLGDGEPVIVPAVTLPTDRLVMVGTRALDDAEADYIESSGIRCITPAEASAESVAAAVRATGATSVYIHIDLDVLDPSEMSGVGLGEPFGLALETLVASIAAIRAELPVVGAAITEFAPESMAAAADDLPSILRVLSAITAPNKAA